jgi:hypothetical protein
MTTYDSAGHPILIPSTLKEFQRGNPAVFVERYLRTRYGPIVKSGAGQIADDPADVSVYINGNGPITGAGASLTVAYPIVTLVATTAIFLPAHIGRNIVITGCTNPANNGTFPILTCADSHTITFNNVNAATVTESFAFTSSGVTAVFGLLGIIVLDQAPLHTDLVQTSYQHMPSPTVEIRRMNSVEYGANRDGARAKGQRYLYRNVLLDTSQYSRGGARGGTTPTEPELNGYFYRGYERAYSIALNDPNLLLMNAPFHKVSYPPFRRALTETLVSYDAVTLPEDATDPWTRYGTGTVTVGAGILSVTAPGGGFPTNPGLYYWHATDFTFTHTMSYSFRGRATAYTLHNDFSGVAAGVVNGDSTIMLSFLEHAGTRWIGVLRGGDESLLTSYVSYALDWTAYHIYRIYRSATSVVVYVDSNPVPVISVPLVELARTYNLDIGIDFVSGVFYGSMSRDAAATSQWDYIRYLITPNTGSETRRNIHVQYVADALPAAAPTPWTRVGRYGTETILGGDTVLVAKTSASQPPYNMPSPSLP